MSGSLSISRMENDVAEAVDRFRHDKSATLNSLVLKIDKESHIFVLEESFEDSDLETIRDSLPARQPRFVLLSYPLNHGDGRVSYPLCMVFISPSGCNPELQMLYAGSRNELLARCNLTKSCELRDVDDLTEEFLDGKLKS